MEKLGLPLEAMIGSPASRLSVGQQQRVAVARALNRPAIANNCRRANICTGYKNPFILHAVVVRTGGVCRFDLADGVA